MARHALLLAYLLVSTIQSIFANVPNERPRPEQEPSLNPGVSSKTESGGGRQFTTLPNENNEPCCPGHSFIPHRNHGLNFKNSYDTTDNQPSNDGENKREDHTPESFSTRHSQPIERNLPKEPNNGLENFPNSPQGHSARPHPGIYNVAPEDKDLKDLRPTDDRSGSGRSALTNNPIQHPGSYPKSDLPDSRTGQNDSPLNAEKPNNPGRFDNEARDNNGLKHTEMNTGTNLDQNNIPKNRENQPVEHDRTGLEKNNNEIVPERRQAQQGNSYVPNRVCQHCFTPKKSELTGPTNHSPRSGGNSLPPGEMRSSDNVNNNAPNNPRNFFPNSGQKYNFKSHPNNHGSNNVGPNRNNYDWDRSWRNGSHLADGRSGYDRHPENLDNRDDNLVNSYNRGNGRSSQGEHNGNDWRLGRNHNNNIPNLDNGRKQDFQGKINRTPYTWRDRSRVNGGDYFDYYDNGENDQRGTNKADNVPHNQGRNAYDSHGMNEQGTRNHRDDDKGGFGSGRSSLGRNENAGSNHREHGGNSHKQDFWGYGHNDAQDGRLGHRHGQNNRGVHQDEHPRGNVKNVGNNHGGHNSRGSGHSAGHGLEGNRQRINSHEERNQGRHNHRGSGHNGEHGPGRRWKGEPTHEGHEQGGNTHRDQNIDENSHRPNSLEERNQVLHNNRGMGQDGEVGHERSWPGRYEPHYYHGNKNGTNSLEERNKEEQHYRSTGHNEGVGLGRSSQGEPTHKGHDHGGNTHRDHHPDGYSHRPNNQGARNPLWHYNRGSSQDGGPGNERFWQGRYRPHDHHGNKNGTNSLGERNQEGQHQRNGGHNGGVGHGRSSQGEPTRGDSEIGGNTHRDHYPDGYSHSPNNHGERNPLWHYNRGSIQDGRPGSKRIWQGRYRPHDHHGDKNGTNSLGERNQEGRNQRSGGHNGGVGNGRSSQGEPTHGDREIGGNTHRDDVPDGNSHRPNSHGGRNPVGHYNRGSGHNGRLGNERGWQGRLRPHDHHGNKHNNLDERNQEGQNQRSGSHNGGVGNGRSAQGEPTRGDREIGGNTHRDHYPDVYSHRPNNHGERNPLWHYNRGSSQDGGPGGERIWQGRYRPHDHHGNKNGTNSLGERNQEGQHQRSGGHNGGVGNGRSSQGDPTHGDREIGVNTQRDDFPDGNSHRPNSQGEGNPVGHYNRGSGHNGRLGNERGWQGRYRPHDHHGNKHNNLDERNQEGQHHRSSGHNGGVGHGRSSQGGTSHGDRELRGNTYHPDGNSHRPDSHGERNPVGRGGHHHRESGHSGRGYSGERSWEGGPTRWGHEHNGKTHGINSHGERNLGRRQPGNNIPNSDNRHGRSGQEENWNGQNEHGLEEERNRPMGGYSVVNGRGNNGGRNWTPRTNNHLGNENYCCIDRKNQRSHNPRENKHGHTGINYRGNNSQGETEQGRNTNEESNLNDRVELVKSNGPQSDDNNLRSNNYGAPDNKMSGEENGSKELQDVEPEAPMKKENNHEKSPPRRPFHRVVEDDNKPGMHGKGRSGQGGDTQAEDLPEESSQEANSFDENNEVESSQNDQRKFNDEAHSNEVTPDYRNYDYGRNYGRVYNRNEGYNHGNGGNGQWRRQTPPANFRHNCPHCNH